MSQRFGHLSRPFSLSIAAGAILFATASFAQNVSDPLQAGFQNPPASARPRVWWHWMNGNIAKEGIRLDLEWMHRVGIAGFQNFDAALATPQTVDHRLAYMTPEWKDAFRYATTLADQLGMEEAIAGSPGWSETGGPWVSPSEGMKKYVWSETVLMGGEPFHGRIGPPPGISGPFQSMSAGPGPKANGPQFYADSAVIAYRSASDDVSLPSPIATSSSGAVDGALLFDDDLTTGVTISKAPDPGAKAWIQLALPGPRTIRAVSLCIGARGVGVDLGGGNTSNIAVEASDDGTTFRTIVEVPRQGAVQHTLSFAPTTARYFRLTFRNQPTPTGASKAQGGTLRGTIFVSEFLLHTGARVHRFEEKAAFRQLPDLYAFPTPEVLAGDAIRKADVVDLTSRMHPDGTLDWTPPSGRWVVLRMGYSLIGTTNHPATQEATGLEVDKLDRRYVKRYMDHYLDTYRDTVGPELMGKRGIQYVITDSWEAGTQNWTDNMLAQFRRLRGYDPTPWLPVLAGHIVESAQASDGFLWDFRQTIADLTADEHYGQISASLKERGMGHYGESHESGRALIADGMSMKKRADVPMGAMWTGRLDQPQENLTFNADDRESASVAHLYGQNLAAAESMTAGSFAWAWSPATLKPTADQEFLNGINRIVIHESAHQPLADRAPGLTLGKYGQWFNRNETWAELAGPWIQYLGRTSYLLQQGRFAADLLYFYGEDSNVTAIFSRRAPEIPAGYSFDYLNADALENIIHAEPGQLTTASGMHYRLLVLDPYSRHMSLPVLRSLYALVKAGAVVVGAKPVGTPSLADDPTEFEHLARELFGDGSGIRRTGLGIVYAGQDTASVLKALNLAPDFETSHSQPEARIEFVHRILPDGELYFLDNRSAHDQSFEATFRTSGKTPELWRAESGSVEPVSFRSVGGRTSVPLHLEPWGTVFVVFRRPAAAPSLTLPVTSETILSTLGGPWTVAFQPGRGAPPSVIMDRLVALDKSSDAGIRYFSGAGTYTQTLDAPAAWFQPGVKLWLDLGEVRNVASVSVNGQPAEIAWHAPYRVDVTAALKPGANTLSITVVNAWVNRLIGDAQPGATRIAHADVDPQPYDAKSPLLPSGLLGPVRVTRSSVEEK